MNKHFKLRSIIFLFLIAFIVFSGCHNNKTVGSGIITAEQTEFPQDIAGTLEISYLDVGQGDSIFIQLPNDESILIDAGNSENGTDIIQYIKDRGEDTLDYVIATHPHADHIGGMAEVINAFEVQNVYMPKAVHTSKTYENLLDIIAEKGLRIQTAKAGKVMIDSGDIKAEFLAPNSDSYADLNNYSAVLLLTYNKNRFLFMGDAESESEAEILSSGVNVSADVLKVGHHGSDTSSSQRFIKAVQPKYAVISVGSGNSYGHPDDAALDILRSSQAEIWRTDKKGTITVISNGEILSASRRISSEYLTNAPPATESAKETDLPKDNQYVTVYITRTGKKYHRDGCKYLSNGKIPVDLNELDLEKYTPCSVCKPTARN